MDAQNMELSQSQLDMFIDLIRKAKERNDGSILAACAILNTDHDCPGLLAGHAIEDYQKAIRILQRPVPQHEHAPIYRAAIDYIRTNFLSEEVKADA